MQNGADRTVPPRLAREWRTLVAMIRLYCRQVHRGAAGLCPDCLALRRYADERLRRCPFGPRKPTCVACPIHCYRPEIREKIRVIMRYSGPRLLGERPLLALAHLLDGLRPVPSRRR